MRKGRSRLAFGLALCGCAAWLVVLCPAATPAADTTRVVTVQLLQTGSATWSTAGADTQEQLTLTYGWRGLLRFAVPTDALANPALAFTVRSVTTLKADWEGDLKGAAATGARYSCRYTGRHVVGRVTAALSNGRKPGTLRLVLHAKNRYGFFPRTSRGARVSCNSPLAGGGPAHFEPAWLFRDNLQDHGRLTSDTAVILVPSALFPHGSVAVTFPHEVGTVDQPLRPKLAWSNKGKLRLRAR